MKEGLKFRTLEKVYQKLTNNATENVTDFDLRSEICSYFVVPFAPFGSK